MKRILIKEGKIVNNGEIIEGDLFISNGRIEKVGGSIDTLSDKEIDASGQFVMPGIIDDQVHFREPGLTHKADIYTEAKAAVVGGTTSFMEMPNTKPTTTTQVELQKKYDVAAMKSLANYSFFMGATNDNLEEVLKTDPKKVCGIKVFMGSSTGNMLVDNRTTLEKLFASTKMLIATHCEDEATIRNNTAFQKHIYGEDIPIHLHPIIRNEEGCYLSSSMAVELAKKHGTRLHILHISTKDELALFTNETPLIQKKITAEVCVHHLYFNSDQYHTLGTKIKCNPAIKNVDHQSALLPALLNDTLDIIATDHAPHTVAEKSNGYLKAPSGLPLVQHSLNVMLDFYHQGKISMEKIVEKMCHAPAMCFKVKDRGFLNEGMHADVVVVDPNKQFTVSKDNIYYKCGWSPLEGKTFKGQVTSTIVSGYLAYHNGMVNEQQKGSRLEFY